MQSKHRKVHYIKFWCDRISKSTHASNLISCLLFNGLQYVMQSRAKYPPFRDMTIQPLFTPTRWRLEIIPPLSYSLNQSKKLSLILKRLKYQLWIVLRILEKP